MADNKEALLDIGTSATDSNLLLTTNQTDQVKYKSTPEGMACAYLSIMFMALLPILFGSFKSVKHQIETHVKCEETGEQAETMTTKDALIFPLIASCALIVFYILIKISPDCVNLILSGYFFVLGVIALYRLISPLIKRIFPVNSRINTMQYTLLFASRNTNTSSVNNNKDKDTAGDNEDRSETSSPEGTRADSNPSPCRDDGALHPDDNLYVDFKFTVGDSIAFVIASSFGLVYIFTKHWILNNAFGLAFSLNGIELLNLNTVTTGCILLGGLFIYDIFWVFGTDVMVSVAKSFDAPIKLVFPQDFLVNGIWGKHFAMLGLGDIVIPGIFIALLLRFDHSLKRKYNVYFWSCFIAYVLGLGITIGVMTWFKHAQPALLYLVPCCIIVPMTLALIRGDFKSLINYKDHPTPSVRNKDD